MTARYDEAISGYFREQYASAELEAEGKLVAELYTWGANRNASLGVGDGDDRTYPEHVPVRAAAAVGANVDAGAPLQARFGQARVLSVGMGKLHTGAWFTLR